MKKLAKNIFNRFGYSVYKTPPPSPPRDLVQAVCDQYKVERIEPPALKAYHEVLPPLAAPPVRVEDSGVLKHYTSVGDALRNISIEQYFKVSEEQGALSITDDYAGSVYHARQRMLYAVYQKHYGASLSGARVLDIGCSSGYYSFFCARMGAASVVGTDARPEHQDQFNLLHSALKMPGSCVYRHVDMEGEMEDMSDTADLVLAQGVIYHVYDHPRFIKNLYRLTDKVLILEGACSGREDMLCLASMEDPTNLRESIHGPVLYPSLGWMIELARWAGFKTVQYVNYPADLPPSKWFNNLWRAMLVCVKE